MTNEPFTCKKTQMLRNISEKSYHYLVVHSVLLVRPEVSSQIAVHSVSASFMVDFVLLYLYLNCRVFNSTFMYFWSLPVKFSLILHMTFFEVIDKSGMEYPNHWRLYVETFSELVTSSCSHGQELSTLICNHHSRLEPLRIQVTCCYQVRREFRKLVH